MHCQYHIMNTMEEWFELPYPISEGNARIPMRFSYKYNQKNSVRDFYIPPSTVMALLDIRAYAEQKNIPYKPATGIEKYVYDNCSPEMKFNYSKKSPEVIHSYPVPQNEFIARSVCATYYSDCDDKFESDPDNEVIYYYLSVLVITKHPIFEKIVLGLQSGAYDINLQPATTSSNALKYKTEPEYSFYSLYPELIYFISLILPPADVDKENATDAEIIPKVNKRITEQHKIFCESIGITDYKPVIRGQTFRKIVTFWKMCPKFRCAIIQAVLKPPVHEGSFGIMEDQTIKQLKELWFEDVSKWGPLNDFHKCYFFAVNPITEAHKIPAVVADSEMVKALYKKLKDAVDGDENLTEFAPFLIADKEFFEEYDVKNYQNLLYAVKSLQYNNNKKNNLEWAKFLGMQPISVPYKEIDRKLAVPLTNNNEEHKNC